MPLTCMDVNGHGIADYPTCARLRFTEAASVLLETYQSRTDAPLQSMFTLLVPLCFARQCLQLGRT